MAAESCCSEDTAWLHGVIRQYESQLVRYAARLLGDNERARDVAQDTFLRLCRQPREKVEDGLRQWLFTVCRNRAMDIRKKENRMRTLDEEKVDDRHCREATQLETLEQKETAGRASQLLDDLPENQREVILLKVQDGLSYREISEVTGLSVSNVGFLLHKGFKTLRQKMNFAAG